MWEVADPPISAVTMHGRGDEACRHHESAVVLDGLVWLAQSPPVLSAAGASDALVEQVATIARHLVEHPDRARKAFADARFRAWLAELRRRGAGDALDGEDLDRQLGGLALLAAPWLGQVAPAHRFVGYSRPGRLSPLGTDVVFDVVGWAEIVAVGEGAFDVDLDGTSITFRPGADGTPAVVGTGEAGAVSRRTFITGDIEVIAAGAFPELAATRRSSETTAAHSVAELERRVGTAFDCLAAAWPAALLDVRRCLRGLLPIETDDGRWHSATTGDLPLTVQLTLGDPADDVTLAESIVHETAHVKLDELLVMDPLLTNGPEAVFRHPWRPDLRPLLGVLLGVHAFANVLRFYEMALVKSVDDAARVLTEIDQRQPEVAQALATLEQHAQFTDVGARLFDDLRATVG
jgi:HEXXH motif-containing protein